MPVNHAEIKARLIELEFKKVIQSDHGCWVNEDGIVCYFAPNSEIQNTYIIGYKDSRMFFNKVTELNTIIKEINSRINANISGTTPKEIRYKSRL